MTSQPEIPSDARRALLAYNVLFPFALAILLPGYLVRMIRRGNFRKNFGQRLGRYSGADRGRFAKGRWIWMHSISVGETLIALKLARELRHQEPTLQIVITVTTSTGFALASESASEWIAILYNPIDAPGIIRRTLDLIQPEQLILLEGEAWPNLLAQCHKRGIPVSLVNARLSPRSHRRMTAGKRWIGPIFRLITRITIPDPIDIARWQEIGVDPGKIQVTGSIKFDRAIDPQPSREQEFRTLLAPLSITTSTPILLAGSTWHPEEIILTQAFLNLRREFPDLLLILVPRHIERTDSILRDLSHFALQIVRRSELKTPTRNEPGVKELSQRPDVLLIDTTGELRDWYALATVVFVGKSLPGISQIGGQNPAEPASLGKPVLFGPHMENFQTLVEHLHQAQAALTVANQVGIEEQTANLLRHPGERERLAIRTRIALTPHSGATERTALELLKGH